MLHLTPRLFGRELSQSVIGVQMAASYVGSLALAPLFGVVGQSLGFWLFPVALLALSLVVLGAFVALMTLKEYLMDYASPATKEAGDAMIAKEVETIPNEKVRAIVRERIGLIEKGERDFRF